MRALLTLCIAAAWSKSLEARNCPLNVMAAARNNMIYLYYPTTQDQQFPDMGGTAFRTRPLNAFNISQLDSSIGTEAELIARVETLVWTGLCEFNVGVTTVREAPSPTGPRWQIVGIASDQTGSPMAPVGQAQSANDHGDGTAKDYVRFWVGDLANWARRQDELTGANSTLERWATGMANIILHEVGHNHGTGHADAAPRADTDEDATPNHFMTTLNATTPQAFVRALNHHSDRSYEALAHAVGLAAQTVTNWDFVNPNSSAADRFVIRLATPASASAELTLGWVYGGPQSPWREAFLQIVGGAVLFQGTPHYLYELHFFGNNPQWANGPSGIIPRGAPFHTGASIHGGNYVVYDAILYSGGAELPLHPRMIDFAGTIGFKLTGGSGPGFSIRLANPNPARGPLLVTNVDVQFSPRMIDIETMVSRAVPSGLDERPAALYTRPRMDLGREIPDRATLSRRLFVLGRNPVTIPIALLTDPRHLMVVHPGCAPGAPPSPRPPWTDNDGECSRGTQLSLFPATYVYVTATVVDPLARHWDVRRRRMVRGPLATRIFFQVAGTVPDANGNGIDDLLDIRAGRSRDFNFDGVPDEAAQEPQPRPDRR